MAQVATDESAPSVSYLSPLAPNPLPSRKEIEAAPHIQTYWFSRIAKLSDAYLVKYGKRVTPIEAENMIFVKQNTTIRVPEVFAVFTYPEDDFTFIIMEFIEGEALNSAWEKLKDSQKGQISAVLTGYMEQLRSIPPPEPAYFGTIGRRPYEMSTFWISESLPSLAGPFESEAELNAGMIQGFLIDGGPRIIHRAEFFKRAFKELFHDHPPVFTHADFQKRNIIVNLEDRENPRVVMIDWESASWLPNYYEYSLATTAHVFDDDWEEWLCKILEPFYIECPYLTNLIRERIY